MKFYIIIEFNGMRHVAGVAKTKEDAEKLAFSRLATHASRWQRCRRGAKPKALVCVGYDVMTTLNVE